MKNDTAKEVRVISINELLLEIIINIINNPDIQFFISFELIKRLLEENRERIIWEEDVIDSIYYDGRIEKAYLISLSAKNESNVFQIHFIRINTEYILITFFAYKEIIFRSYNKKMDEIIIIKTD